MKIERLRAYMTRDKDRPRVLLAMDTDAGITGWGECYNHGPDRALLPLLNYLSTFLAGRDPRRIEFLIQYLMQQTRFPPGALGLAAISAIDHCLWDISAKALGVPVYMLLGGHARDRVRVYAGVYTAPDPERARDEMDALHEGWGFTAFKLSPYRIDMHAHRWGEVVRTSAEYFRQLRETVDSRYEIAFDAHAKIFEPRQAAQLGNALAPYDPLFFEEPLRPENFEAWGELHRDLTCTLATGESLYSRFEFLRLLQVRGCDIIQPDICVVGGLLEMRKIAALAEAHFVTVAPHNPMGPLATAVNVHFSAAQPNFRILEYRLPNGANYAFQAGGEKGTPAPQQGEARYVLDPYLPRDGYLELRPDRPGWGVEIDEEYLKTDRYIHWERKVPLRPDGSTAFA
ncbi:mandelate racemase/muconate lactonizing enzyme family protein [Roseomonas marmotae]|uniref:Mandelate racemase/muconate lactonizing enzyme family protein n=1 Tax=Roseomonas marmotae TaxID=2768161 RepID=A0ABS3KCK8_9PROT|nr:mandelate racemase/muconate lactonizing enzyme family protein [Roseomonas marmotae]MBO1075190.1 mandelate racemase/muconate lactonizing enzyme family protein [Roseomonas marmotae]QTI79701.1 mandelate racemase/muconate lactonizing enzyme family protein [Roseomonas marmotae]